MMDYSLGGDVDVGQYDGPILDGKPLHSGNCSDGVYGCIKCNAAARRLTDDQRTAIGFDNEEQCDVCGKRVHASTLSYRSFWDEPSVKQMMCVDCRSADAASYRAESEPIDDSCDDDYTDSEPKE